MCSSSVKIFSSAFERATPPETNTFPTVSSRRPSKNPIELLISRVSATSASRAFSVVNSSPSSSKRNASSLLGAPFCTSESANVWPPNSIARTSTNSRFAPTVTVEVVCPMSTSKNASFEKISGFANSNALNVQIGASCKLCSEPLRCCSNPPLIKPTRVRGSPATR